MFGLRFILERNFYGSALFIKKQRLSHCFTLLDLSLKVALAGLAELPVAEKGV